MTVDPNLMPHSQEADNHPRNESTLAEEISNMGERFPKIAVLLSEIVVIKNKWFPLG